MTISVHGLATALQKLLSIDAEVLATATGFCRRRRMITGANFAQSLILSWMGNPRADLDELAMPLGVTVQALQERFNDRAVQFLKGLLSQAMNLVFAARPEMIPLLRRFPAVIIEDTTTCPLPASLAAEYPGCGGSDPEAGQAGLKLMVRLEAQTGAVQLGRLAPARDSDRARLGDLPPLPRGSLRLLDLGFFDLKRMAQETDQELFWISRVPSRLKVQSAEGAARNISDWLRTQKSDRIDRIVTVGTRQRLTCRLVAVRAPEAVVQQRLKRLRRRASKQGRRLSPAQRALCGWTVLITNLVEAARFHAEQLWALYRVRWQVELLFKRWKSEGGLGQSRGRTANRVLCELLAKLLAVLIRHWGTLLRSGPLGVVSATRASHRVKRWADRLAMGLRANDSEAIVEVLKQLKRHLDRLPKRPRRKRPTTRQLLYSPRFAI